MVDVNSSDIEFLLNLENMKLIEDNNDCMLQSQYVKKIYRDLSNKIYSNIKINK